MPPFQALTSPGLPCPALCPCCLLHLASHLPFPPPFTWFAWLLHPDEIDAIGKARSTGPTDSGTQEREQGLMQMLTEMDGFYQKDNVGCGAGWC